MANTGAFFTGLAFTITLFTAGEAPAAQDELKGLVLHVDNYARVPPAVLARAEAEAARVYAAAGVRTTWVHGDDEANARDAGGLHLQVLLLCREKTAHKVASDHLDVRVLGRAARETARAYVLTPRVIEAALGSGRLFELVLGRVMAHEIGHLLLPRGSHSAQGIMQEHLNLTSKAAVTFTALQAAEIQMALNR